MPLAVSLSHWLQTGHSRTGAVTWPCGSDTALSCVSEARNRSAISNTLSQSPDPLHGGGRMCSQANLPFTSLTHIFTEVVSLPSRIFTGELGLVAPPCTTLCDPMDCNPGRPLCPWNSPGKNTRVGCHALLQGIFPTQGSNPGLLHCRQILYHLNH